MFATKSLFAFSFKRSLIIFASILIQVILVSSDVNNDCRNYGTPVDIDLVVNKSNTLVYKCHNTTVLVGDRERKCVNGKLSGSVPICMPFLSTSKILYLSGNASDLVYNNNSKCLKGPVWMVFDTMRVNHLFVWTEQSCANLAISTSVGVFNSNISVASNNQTSMHMFTVDELVASINISEPCCINRIFFSVPISVRCGRPDLPENAEFKMMGVNSGLFSCSSGYKLNGSSNGSTECIGLEKWSNSNIECVKLCSWWIILLCCVALILLIIVSFFIGARVVSMSDVEFDQKTLFQGVVDNYPGAKIDLKQVSLMKLVEKEDECCLHTAQYRGKIVFAHICQISSVNKKNRDSVETMRCLFQAVRHDYKHRNLVSLLAISNDPKSSPMLVFEFFGNGHLDHYVRSNTNLHINNLIRLSLDVCNGMVFLSQNRVIHQNLRGKSCYVDDSETVKIGNFKYCQSLEAYDQFMSKDPVSRERMPWAAPETIADNITSAQSDVWSYGVVLWEIFSSGSEPFSGMTDLDITSFLLEERRLSKPDKCSAKLYSVMLNCWKTDSNERPTFGDLRRQMEELVK